MTAKIDSLDSIIDDIDEIFSSDENSPERAAITIWIPKASKEKYEALQGKSNRKFSKKLRTIAIESIDRVYDKEI